MPPAKPKKILSTHVHPSRKVNGRSRLHILEQDFEQDGKVMRRWLLKSRRGNTRMILSTTELFDLTELLDELCDMVEDRGGK